MSSDPSFANVSLLLHFDGSNGSTTFTDASPTPKTVTASGNAQISTAHSQFGGASGYFDGSGDFISTASSSDFSLGTGDFTLEFFTRYTGGTTGGYNTIFFLTDGSQRLEIRLSDSGFGYSLQANLATGATIGEVLTASGTTRTTLQNVWAHIAVSRASGTTRIFVNGVLGGSTTLAYNIASAATVRVGATNNSGQSYLGFVDDLRVTKGVARYTGNFTPPTEAFPNSAPPIELIASASTPLGAASAYAQSVIVSQAQASTPLGSALAFAFSGHIAFAAADSPLGTVSALSVVVSACRIASGGPLGVPATLARHSIAARVSAASPLGIAQAKAWHDFTGQIGDTATRYVMDLITPSGTVRVPISSWQATLRTGASSYVQCVIPAAQPWGATINAATSFRIYRRAVTTGGQVFEYLMAEAPADTPQFDRGPTNPTCTLSGYAPGFAGQDVSPGTDRTLAGIRSISSGASYRVRCAVDWLLRPGQRGVVDGVPFVVEWINYYVNTNDAYMEAGT